MKVHAWGHAPNFCSFFRKIHVSHLVLTVLANNRLCNNITILKKNCIRNYVILLLPRCAIVEYIMQSLTRHWIHGLSTKIMWANYL